MSRKIPLTRGYFAIVDDDDFGFLNSFRWRARGDKHVYAVKPIAGKKLLRMHTLLMGPPRGFVVDHKNGNTLDNRRCNLRVCTISQNAGNRHGPSCSATGYFGVYTSKAGGFRARIRVNNITYYLGTFPDAVSAAKAHDREAIRLRGPLGPLNFPSAAEAA